MSEFCTEQFNNRRTILHCDLNSFFASVEVKHRPELKGKAVAVNLCHQSAGLAVGKKSQRQIAYGVEYHLFKVVGNLCGNGRAYGARQKAYKQ